jgi:hypothetical protein
MEEVLEVYHRFPDPQNPVVAMDEQPIQLLRHTRQVIPARPSENGHVGHPERVDYEYERNGTASVFMFVAPFGVAFLFGNTGQNLTWRRNWNGW